METEKYPEASEGIIKKIYIDKLEYIIPKIDIDNLPANRKDLNMLLASMKVEAELRKAQSEKDFERLMARMEAQEEARRVEVERNFERLMEKMGQGKDK